MKNSNANPANPEIFTIPWYPPKLLSWALAPWPKQPLAVSLHPRRFPAFAVSLHSHLYDFHAGDSFGLTKWRILFWHYGVPTPHPTPPSIPICTPTRALSPLEALRQGLRTQRDPNFLVYRVKSPNSNIFTTTTPNFDLFRARDAQFPIVAKYPLLITREHHMVKELTEKRSPDASIGRTKLRSVGNDILQKPTPCLNSDSRYMFLIFSLFTSFKQYQTRSLCLPLLITLLSKATYTRAPLTYPQQLIVIHTIRTYGCICDPTLKNLLTTYLWSSCNRLPPSSPNKSM